MRLLHARTLKLREFLGTAIPPYAILSHTWEDGEVSFQEMLPGYQSQKPGYQKVKYSCQQALKDNLEYVWVDTCCIDKSSSAELTEAINSMYKWYAEAKVCYAYLADMDPVIAPDHDQLGRCRWFSRGWTLQELIAPRNVVFFAENWTGIGTKIDLCQAIANITGIDMSILRDPSIKALQRLSIATRMSWASQRSTTRVEDIAYCLLGLFNVNMPMLYGEGGKAFTRLQEEILKASDDHSIFAFGSIITKTISRWEEGDLDRDFLASSPAEFRVSGDVMAFLSREDAYSLTNKGLRIPLHTTWSSCEMALLNCYIRGDPHRFLGFEISSSENGDGYCRRRGSTLFLVPRLDAKTFHLSTRYFRNDDILMLERGDRASGWLIERSQGCDVVQVYPEAYWDEKQYIITPLVKDSRYKGWERRGVNGWHFILSINVSPEGRRNTPGQDQKQKAVIFLGVFSRRTNKFWPWCAILEGSQDLEAAHQKATNDVIMTSGREWYQGSRTTSRTLQGEDSHGSFSFEVLLEVKEELVMGQRMFVAVITSKVVEPA